MPIIKSAKKRVRVSNKAAIRNSKNKRSLKAALKAFQAALESGKKINETLATAQSELDTAQKKNILHRNNVARTKKRLATQAKAKGMKITASKPKTAKAKAPAKKTTAKKPAAKKTAAKKPAKK